MSDHDTDGLAELAEGHINMLGVAGAQVIQHLAYQRAGQDRAGRDAAETRAAATSSRADSHTIMARRELASVNDPSWWAHATGQDVGRVWELANRLAPQDPRARATRDHILDQLRQRGITADHHTDPATITTAYDASRQSADDREPTNTPQAQPDSNTTQVTPALATEPEVTEAGQTATPVTNPQVQHSTPVTPALASEPEQASDPQVPDTGKPATSPHADSTPASQGLATEQWRQAISALDEIRTDRDAPHPWDSDPSIGGATEPRHEVISAIDETRTDRGAPHPWDSDPSFVLPWDSPQRRTETAHALRERGVPPAAVAARMRADLSCSEPARATGPRPRPRRTHTQSGISPETGLSI